MLLSTAAEKKTYEVARNTDISGESSTVPTYMDEFVSGVPFLPHTQTRRCSRLWKHKTEAELAVTIQGETHVVLL